jgi:hypothetical protein
MDRSVKESGPREASATRRQLSMAFEALPLHGISPPDRAKAVIHLASLLLQAVGANVGEPDDGER